MGVVVLVVAVLLVQYRTSIVSVKQDSCCRLDIVCNFRMDAFYTKCKCNITPEFLAFL